MIPEISKIKGIHPGIIIKREIRNQGIRNKEFASLLNEHTQTISAILNGKRSINPKLSIKLGMVLGVDSDYFMILQACYDVRRARLLLLNHKTPNLKNIRKVLFWDTDFNKIDWINKRKAVIKRIFERGNEKEISEILNFYGFDLVKNEINNIGYSFLPSFEHNVKKYIENT